MLVHAGLSIIGRKGYELLIDLGIEKARQFAELIGQHQNFELITAPELNILTYRYNPSWLQKKMADLDQRQLTEVNQSLDLITREVQKRQREAGKTFVSRTRLSSARYPGTQISVFRSVLANPLTTEEILIAVLEEQCAIVKQSEVQKLVEQIKGIVA
jgi:glutamate decarboxylase